MECFPQITITILRPSHAYQPGLELAIQLISWFSYIHLLSCLLQHPDSSQIIFYQLSTWACWIGVDFCFVHNCVWGRYRCANEFAVVKVWPLDIFLHCFILLSWERTSHWTTEPGSFCLALLANELRSRIPPSARSQCWKHRCVPHCLASHMDTGNPNSGPPST